MGNPSARICEDSEKLLEEVIPHTLQDIEDYICNDFEVVRKPPFPESHGRFRIFLKNRISPKPTINKALCTNCGTCVRLCPVTPRAVDWFNGDKSCSPSYDYSRCIRCFCCQEVCPESAIYIKETLLSSIFFH